MTVMMAREVEWGLGGGAQSEGKGTFIIGSSVKIK